MKLVIGNTRPKSIQGRKSVLRALARASLSDEETDEKRDNRDRKGAEKGDIQTEKGDIDDIPPHPLNRRNVKETSKKPPGGSAHCPKPQSVGAKGELLAAGWLLEELGLAGGTYDVQMLAKVIRYTARDAPRDVETASKMLREAAKLRWSVARW